MIILDASVLIGHFESADAHHAEATGLLAAHAAESFAASVITLAEVYVGPPGPHKPTGFTSCWRGCRSRAWNFRPALPAVSVSCALQPV
ncbi:pilT domain protein [Mycobacterium xenopi 4042]|uniref:PilT domain protein n=1 Tax=Mycobacterium xenopi 4042 TaxID=1299334 RepID=X8C7C0_MYCXE|nr:pilT domain protein [Mycobacterium xenopi 4042]